MIVEDVKSMIDVPNTFYRIYWWVQLFKTHKKYVLFENLQYTQTKIVNIQNLLTQILNKILVELNILGVTVRTKGQHPVKKKGST